MKSATRALVCIDLQNDFLRTDGRLPVHAEQVGPMLEAIGEAIAHARDTGAPVVHIVNAFPRGSVANLFRKFAAIEGSAGAELDPRAPSPLDNELVVPKAASDGFSNPELSRWLKEQSVDEVILCGVFAGACVRSTAAGAARNGLRVSVLSDGVADRNDRARERALGKMTQAGVGVMTAAQLVGEKMEMEQ